MQPDTGNTGRQGQENVGGSGGGTSGKEPFVKRFEMAVMQYAMLSKAQQGEVTRDNLKQMFRGNLQMSSDHFEHCIQELVQDGHLKDAGGNKYTITDDGREDVHKLETLVQELPNVSQKGGQGQRQGVPAAKTAGGGASAGGGATTGGTSGGNVGGGNVGTTGNVGQQNPGQPKGGAGQSSEGRR